MPGGVHSALNETLASKNKIQIIRDRLLKLHTETDATTFAITPYFGRCTPKMATTFTWVRRRECGKFLFFHKHMPMVLTNTYMLLAWCMYTLNCWPQSLMRPNNNRTVTAELKAFCLAVFDWTVPAKWVIATDRMEAHHSYTPVLGNYLSTQTNLGSRWDSSFVLLDNLSNRIINMNVWRKYILGSRGPHCKVFIVKGIDNMLSRKYI